MDIHPQKSLRHRLRHDTSAAHMALDTQLSKLDLQTREGLMCFLKIQAIGLRKITSLGTVPDYQDLIEALTASATADLHTLSADPCLPVRYDLAPPHPLAVAYVVSGSRLGNEVIKRRWQGAKAPSCNRPMPIFRCPAISNTGGNSCVTQIIFQPIARSRIRSSRAQTPCLACIWQQPAQHSQTAICAMREPRENSDTVEYDLTNCDREPIHILGHVQSYGCLIAVSADWMVTYASVNCDQMLGLDATGLVGTRFVDAFPESTVHYLRTRMQVLSFQDGASRVFAHAVFEDDRLFDVSISQSGQNLIFEFEPREMPGKTLDDGSTVQALIARVQRHKTVDKMAAEAVRAIRMLSGFDRVMAYQFNEDDSGTVIAEDAAPHQDSFLGLRFPASDIPKQARALYVRSRLRIISDVNSQTHAIHPPRDPNGQPLDLSLAVTRTVSPIHLEYLRNMGVEASMSVSIVRNGALWGLFACHNDTPRHVDYETRTAIELFAQLFNYELAQIEMAQELAEFDLARNLHDTLMVQLSGEQDMSDAFDIFVDNIQQVIPFDGAAMYADGVYRATGSAPTQEEFIGLTRFLNTTPPGQVYQTDNLQDRYKDGADFADRVAGILALPISRTPRDYLVLFRREIASSVNWAGNPDKPLEFGPNGARLTPRKSFAAWQQIVRGQSAPWRSSEQRAADGLRITLLEVVLKMADERNIVRKRAQDQQEILIAELNHRVRNILNLIQGLVSQGKKTAHTMDEYRSVLDARIFALARAHDQLTQTEWDWVSLRGLLDTEIQAYLTDKASRVILDGDDIDLSPNAFTTLALVVHELVTNSVKYGALKTPNGSVGIGIAIQPDDSIHITWRERNGPPVQPPSRRGFGTTIIERSIPFELKGHAEIRYHITGFEADFMIPAPHVRKSRSKPAPLKKAVQAPAPDMRMEGTCLVLEDNMVIALDASDMLADLGASYVHIAGSVADALEFLEKNQVEFGVLDVNLGDETSLPVIEKCQDAGIPILLATGYGAQSDLVEKVGAVEVLKKPYNLDSLRAAIAVVRARQG